MSIKLLPTHKYCIIACDGLWDVCTNYDPLIEIVKSKGNPLEMAKSLVDYALKNGSRDNVSVLVLQLNDIKKWSNIIFNMYIYNEIYINHLFFLILFWG